MITNLFSASSLYGTNNIVLANGKTKPLQGNQISLGDFRNATVQSGGGGGTTDASSVLAMSVARYEMNNSVSYPGTGTTIADASGNGNDLSFMNNPTYTASPPSLTITASNQRALSGVSRNFLTNINTFSIEAVVNPAVHSISNRWVCQWNNSLGQNGHGIGLRINNGVPTMTNMMNGTAISTGTSINTNQWYHIVVVVNTSAATSFFYINNTKVAATGNLSMTNFTTIGRYYSIGDMQDNIRQTLIGSIGIVRWYPVTLTDADVNSLYNSAQKSVYNYA